MKNLQKLGRLAAIILSFTYILGMGFVFSVLSPIADSSLAFDKYMDFIKTNKTIIFIWHFIIYFINGICLIILILVLYEIYKDIHPQIIKISTSFGFILTLFVFLSVLITNYGIKYLISLYVKNLSQLEILRITIDTITLSIDHSDKFLGGLWIGLQVLLG
ncbi:MAG: hypothetical protein A2086_08430 [Spirochaetes bacterium GWD1_27_9]|nr:MAG: hypothetical protein A2Z98_00205 [Spirochaetes bacterium GWB1_27_13]OHD20827.1 MAG: hypothetical protein A2Y34_12705 [Spirochaetes bacterium GWC1_27_15]OHD30608.1 MAG: hypothetical protein A2086_08430 [Spirochaetes bacterium GWD1_27_9]